MNHIKLIFVETVEIYALGQYALQHCISTHIEHLRVTSQHLRDFC
jgi:hypothetical protein